jgi:hypothetical protein
MSSPSPDRVRKLVTDLATDEEHAAELIELIHMISDSNGDQVQHGLALKAIEYAYSATDDCRRSLDKYLQTFESEIRLASGLAVIFGGLPLAYFF